MYRNLHRHSQRPASTMKLLSQPGIVIHKLLPKLSLLSHHRSTRGAKTMILMRHRCSTLGAKTTSTILMRHHCSTRVAETVLLLSHHFPPPWDNDYADTMLA